MTPEEKRKKHAEYMKDYLRRPENAKKNREKVKEWRKNNPGFQRSPKRKAGRSSEYRQIIVNTLIQRDGLICGLCGESLEGSDFHINHIVPVALGGEHSIANVELTHPSCNLSEAVAIRKEIHGY